MTGLDQEMLYRSLVRVGGWIPDRTVSHALIARDANANQSLPRDGCAPSAPLCRHVFIERATMYKT